MARERNRHARKDCSGLPVLAEYGEQARRVLRVRGGLPGVIICSQVCPTFSKSYRFPDVERFIAELPRLIVATHRERGALYSGAPKDLVTGVAPQSRVAIVDIDLTTLPDDGIAPDVCGDALQLDELRGRGLDLVRGRVRRIGAEPSFVVDSGWGCHFHYALTRAERAERVAVLNRALARRLGADRKVTSSAHMLRVPGSWNFKVPGCPRPVQVMRASGRTYDIEELEQAVGILTIDREERSAPLFRTSLEGENSIAPSRPAVRTAPTTDTNLDDLVARLAKNWPPPTPPSVFLDNTAYGFFRGFGLKDDGGSQVDDRYDLALARRLIQVGERDLLAVAGAIANRPGRIAISPRKAARTVVRAFALAVRDDPHAGEGTGGPGAPAGAEGAHRPLGGGASLPEGEDSENQDKFWESP